MIYIEHIPYMKALPRQAMLPKGTPTMFGNLIFLMSRNINESIQLINNQTIKSNNKYYYYYYNMEYRGVLYNRKYIIRDLQVRKANYAKVQSETNLHPHPLKPLDRTKFRNTYFDMYKYLEIFFSMTEKMPYRKRLEQFWIYLENILSLPVITPKGGAQNQQDDDDEDDAPVSMGGTLTEFREKYVLVDAGMYPFRKGPFNLKESLNNPLFIMYYTMYRFPELLKNIKVPFLFYCGNFVMKVNFSECNKSSYTIFKRELAKLHRHMSIPTIEDNIPDSAVDEEFQKDEVKTTLMAKYNFTGSKPESTEDVTDLSQLKKPKSVSMKTTSIVKGKTPPAAISSKKAPEEIIEEAIDEKVTQVTKRIKKQLSAPDVSVDMTEPDVASQIKELIEISTEEAINDDKELVDRIYSYTSSQKMSKPPISSKRDQELRLAQLNVKLSNTRLEDLIGHNSPTKQIPIPVKTVEKKITTSNPNMRTVKFSNFEKTYNDTLMSKDIASAFASLNTKSIPMYIRSIDVKETSDELNYKDTYTVVLEDSNRVRHTVTVDLPKFLDDKFMYLGGNKKLIIKQNFMYPVVKTERDTVQIVTNRNKMFIRRVGTRSLGNIERMKKFLSTNDEVKQYFTFGNAAAINKDYISFIEYDELSKFIVKFEAHGVELYFNQKEAVDQAESKGIKVPAGHVFIGFENESPMFIDLKTQTTQDNRNIDNIIFDALPSELQDTLLKIRSGKRLMYNNATIMEQDIPLVSLIAFWEGLSTIMKKLNMEYRFTDRYPADRRLNESVIRFSDGYLVYSDNVEISLLMNGLNYLNTTEYTFEEFDTQEPYIDYFKRVYGKSNIVNPLMNSYEFMIDPITLEILNDINLPTDIVSLSIYASSLLADNGYTRENNQTLYRVRSNEIVPAILYTAIASNYIMFKNSSGKKKFSIPRDAVIKQLLTLQTVEDYSVLNPIVELEKSRTITAKGWRGANKDESYGQDKRSYDSTMMGIMAMSTAPDANCGVVRELALEPNVTSARGYLDIKEDDIDSLKDVNLFSAAELLSTLGASRDDSIRTAMATKQSKHIIPVAKSSPVLISNGAEQTVRFSLSSDFVINAKDDGEVVEKNKKNEIMIVKYANGETQAIDLAPHIVKNGAGGFYLANQLLTKLEVGDKFEKDDLLAWHKDFFTDSEINGSRLNIGTLQKVAIMSSYNTYQDSCFITDKMSHDAAAEIVFQKAAVIGQNSNIDYIVNVGDKVDVGDTLIQYDTSYNEADLNKLLKFLSSEAQEEINQTSKNNIKSKVSGIIEDIKIYATVELDEMSPSLRAIVEAYYQKINGKKKLLTKYDKSESIVKCGLLLNETTGKIEPSKFGLVKGYKIGEGVLIEFYIKHTNVLGVGDKITYFTALKSIVGEIIPEGYEPYSEFRPGEEVSSTIAQSAILKRMTPSIILTMFGNKVLVELKRALSDIYYG